MRQAIIFENISSAADGQNLLPSLAQLLDTVQKQLDADREAARALVLRATSLLRTEMDRQASDRQPGTRPGGLAGWQTRRLVAFIEEHLDRPILVGELSDICKLSATHFCRVFKRSFGETAHSYIVKRRLAKAQTLMLTSDLPLSEISISCGFVDQAHLCKLFRQQHDQSPAAWRRERSETCGLRAKRGGGVSCAAELR